MIFFFFFFQAEDGIRDLTVTGVQTCALPIWVLALRRSKEGAVLGVAVELVVPSEAFWGVNFQLKKTNAQLYKLEQALLSGGDRKSTRLNSSHSQISYAVFCLKKKKKHFTHMY